MFVVLKCKKFSPPEFQAADIGDRDPDEVIKWFDKAVMECPVCGPCSHVELSFGGYITIESKHETEDAAIEAAKQAKEKARGRKVQSSV